MPDNDCFLECQKAFKGKRDGNLEFVGPVKIVFVNRQMTIEYLRTIWYAAAVALGETLLAVVTTIIYFFSFSYLKNDISFLRGLHILLGTLGIHVCLLAGILTLNSYSGAALPLSIKGRKAEHIWVHLLGLGTSAGSAVSAYYAYDFKSILTAHSILGLAAGGAAILTALFGTCICCQRSLTKQTESAGFCSCFHALLGVIAAIASSACLVSGMMKSTLQKWLPVAEMYGYMFACCAVYTAVILIKPVVMIVTRRRIGAMN